jgi:hypothetical protein
MKVKILSLFLLLAAVGAQAQFTRYSAIQLVEGGTNNIVANTTNSYSAAIADVSNQPDVAIQVHGSLMASNYANLRLDFMKSVDGSTWVSTNFVSVVTLTGSNDLSAGTFCIATNVNCAGIRALKLFRIGNVDPYGTVTNLTVTYSIKR